MNDPYLIVSGPHRSGTSMMMSMIEAAGCPVDYDASKDETLANRGELRSDYEPNPGGFKEGGKLAPGVAVKRVCANLITLKVPGPVKMIEMVRPRAERVDSLKRWGYSGWDLQHRLETDGYLRPFLAAHDVELVRVNYHDTLADPAATLADLEAMGWPIKDIEAGSKIPDQNLWRHRHVDQQ